MNVMMLMSVFTHIKKEKAFSFSFAPLLFLGVEVNGKAS